jgi:hypothetical protein
MKDWIAEPDLTQRAVRAIQFPLGKRDLQRARDGQAERYRTGLTYGTLCARSRGFPFSF